MSRKVDEGAVGAFSAIALCAAGLAVFSMTPLAAAPPDYAFAVVGSVMAILACLGVGIGVLVTRLATRRPSDGPAADYDDQPPESRR
jgi:hypothetical protein